MSERTSQVSSSSTPVFQHEAFVYSTDDEFVQRMAPFLLAGLEEGAAAIAVTSAGNRAALREALGPGAEQIAFTDRDDFYVHPARVIASYDATLRQLCRAGAPHVRVIGEVQFGPTVSEWRAWTAYESILNRALAEHLAWVVCPYDTRVLSDQVLDAAWHAHPQVLTDDRRASAHYREPEELVAALTPAPEPLVALRELPSCASPAAVRRQLAAELAAAGVAEAGAMNMLVAANEIAANAWQHADGAHTVRAGLVDGRFVFELSDLGPGMDDPLAGYLPARPGSHRGAGLWIARQLVSRMELLSREPGLTVRLWL